MNTNFKEIGNEFFKLGKYEKAIDSYLKGVESKEMKSQDLLNYYKNLSMCYLKIEKYKETVEWACKAIEICGGDEKSLYRRSIAYGHLCEWANAYRDAKMLIRLDGGNKLYQNHVRSMESRLKAEIDDSQSLVGRVLAMVRVLRDGSDADTAMKVQSINNLTVLARDSASNGAVWTEEVRMVLTRLCDVQAPVEVVEAAQRCLSVLSAGSAAKSLEQFKAHGAQYFANMMFSAEGERCRLGGLYLEQLLSGMTQIKAYKEVRDKHEQTRRENKVTGEFSRPYRKYQLEAAVESVVNECLLSLVRATNSKRLSASGRDSVLEILLRFVPSAAGIGWSQTLLASEGALQKLLEAGAAAHRAASDSGSAISLIATTPRTKMTVATLLAQVYEDLVSDQSRDKFRDRCCDFVMDLFTDEILESKVEAANLIGLLFQGPFEVGTAILGRSGVLEALLLLVRSDVPAHQRVALDAIVLATSKKDKCLAIVAQAVPVLEDIYRTGTDPMKIRALVGMCKLGVAGGRDCSVESLAEGSTLELTRSCKRLLAASTGADQSDPDSTRWALEGLAYLTLQAQVKEALADDPDAVDNLFRITKDLPLDCLYPLCSLLVNVTNSYDKPEVLPELVELARYSKQHVPETHEKDGAAHVARRTAVLVGRGLPQALYHLSAVAAAAHGGQQGCRELLARLYIGVVGAEAHRGAVIQAGGGKALLGLCDPPGNTDAGRVLAAQALARLAINRDPRVAFPGQRSLEVVRPLLHLLRVEHTGLQNFESLLALTNLASLDDAHRRKIVAEHGISAIENYMFEEHEQLRRAATQCVCNLVQLGEVAEKFLGGDADNERVKLLVLLCADGAAEDDADLVLAASGALAVLAADARCVPRITKVKDWVETLQTLLASERPDVRHRGACLLCNMLANGGAQFCEFVASSNMLEVLMAVSKVVQEGGDGAARCASEALRVLEGHGLIQAAQ